MPTVWSGIGLECWFCPLVFMSGPGSNHAAEPPLQKRPSKQRGLHLHIYLAPRSTASLTVGKSRPTAHQSSPTSTFSQVALGVCARRFNSGMQQAGINGMAEREVDKAGGVKG